MDLAPTLPFLDLFYCFHPCMCAYYLTNSKYPYHTLITQSGIGSGDTEYGMIARVMVKKSVSFLPM